MSSEHNQYLRQFFKDHHSFPQDPEDENLLKENILEKKQKKPTSFNIKKEEFQCISDSKTCNTPTFQKEINLKKLFKSIEEEKKIYQNTLHSEIQKSKNNILKEESQETSLQSFASSVNHKSESATFSEKNHSPISSSYKEEKEELLYNTSFEEENTSVSFPSTPKTEKQKKKFSLISSPFTLSHSSEPLKKDISLKSFFFFSKSFSSKTTESTKKITDLSSFTTQFIPSDSSIKNQKTFSFPQKKEEEKSKCGITSKRKKEYRKDIWEKHPERIPFFAPLEENHPPLVSPKQKKSITISPLPQKKGSLKEFFSPIFSKIHKQTLQIYKTTALFFSSCAAFFHEYTPSFKTFLWKKSNAFFSTFKKICFIILKTGKAGVQKIQKSITYFVQVLSSSTAYFSQYIFALWKNILPAKKEKPLYEKEISPYLLEKHLHTQHKINQKKQSFMHILQYGKKVLTLPFLPFLKITHTFSKIQNQNLKDLLQVSGIVAGVFAFGFIGLRAPGFMAQYENVWNADLFAENQKSIEQLVSKPENPFANVQSLPVAGGITVQDSIFPDQTFFDITPPDTRIVIPKIAKNIPILQVDSQSRKDANWEKLESDIQEALKDGVVHYPGTALPGDDGNVFVTGHSSYYPWDPGRYKDVFAALHNLEVGDEYFIFHKGKKYRYIIQERKIVPPSDVSVLDQNYEKKESTLMTCTPIGTAKNRLILKAVQVSSQ